jgi:hypothetical protein
MKKSKSLIGDECNFELAGGWKSLHNDGLHNLYTVKGKGKR